MVYSSKVNGPGTSEGFPQLGAPLCYKWAIDDERSLRKAFEFLRCGDTWQSLPACHGCHANVVSDAGFAPGTGFPVAL